MLRLALFLGVECEPVCLEPDEDGRTVESLEHSIPSSCNSIVLSPKVIRAYIGESAAYADRLAPLLRRFERVIVHGLRPSPSDSAVVRVLSEGQLNAIQRINPTATSYSITNDESEICGAFSGLEFGPPNASNDHVFVPSAGHDGLTSLISIGGLPFLASVNTSNAEVLFLGSSGVADLDLELDLPTLKDGFSRFVPHCMALRHVANESCWQPMKPHACVVIDDPLLRSNYGFVNFDSLLQSARAHRFHATVAFIPHNFDRNSPRILKMFLENPAQLSICFHGNDHTRGELAATDPALLSAILRTAEDRMSLHALATGLPCDRVMVFPQGRYSTEAMRALRAHNFLGAVNTSALPQNWHAQPTLGDLIRPACLRSAGFPLFLRRHIEQTDEFHVAANCFFGKPTIIVTHHDTFANPEPLLEVVDRINSLAPEMQWTNLATIASRAFLSRNGPDGSHHVHAYATTVMLENDSEAWRSYRVDWSNDGEEPAISHVLVDDCPSSDFLLDSAVVRVTTTLPPRTSRTFSIRYRPYEEAPSALGPSWRVRAYIRRRLSEIRDNYLSKRKTTLHAAQMVLRRFHPSSL